eukprot:scaffold11114_cov158-Skeletonema_marinoi.AAC.2
MRPKTDIKKSLDNSIGQIGGLAQLVERVLSMHEVGSSILPFSTVGDGRRKSKQHSISTSLGRPWTMSPGMPLTRVLLE